MTYDREYILELAIKAIKSDSDIIRVEDVIAELPCSKSTFYSMFPDGSDELDTIKSGLQNNRIQVKRKLRIKWFESESAPLQLALYKLMADGDELRALSMQHVDHTTNGEAMQNFTVTVVNKPDAS